jgi:hypothetical protein
MKQRIEHRRAKLPPLLEIDEDGLPVFELKSWDAHRWSSDSEATDELQLGERPLELDD